MAFLLAPPLVLLDEPFGPLDPLSASELWDMLQAYCCAGNSVVLSTHQLPAAAVPDRYLVLEQGIIVAQGTPQALHNTLGGDHEASLEDLLRVAVTNYEETTRDP